MQSNSQNPLISIITVCFNAASTIEKTFQSIGKQTYRNIEYIVIDGGSTDNTYELISKYKHLINYFVSEKDNGIYDAMNKGISLAHGEVIGIINADDFYAPNAIEQVVNAFRTKINMDFVFGNCAIINQSGKVILTHIPNVNYKRGIVNIPHPSTFISKQCYLKYGYYDDSYHYAADYDYFCRLIANKATFFHIEATVSYYRIGGFGTRVGIMGELECLLITYKHWKLFAASCKAPQLLYSYLRRKFGVYLRKCGIITAK